MHGYDRLSGLDASFLALERVETPMHIGSLAILEGEPFFDDDGRFRIGDARQLVGSRLHLIPRFRKRPMSVPFDLGRPIWVDDPRFDVAYHVRLTALPNPGRARSSSRCSSACRRSSSTATVRCGSSGSSKGSRAATSP